MASVVRHASPFTETEKPPPPVVLLLLQTDLHMHTSTSLLIHEDLDHPVPRAKRTVVFAPVSENTYPPPSIFATKVPVPTMLTRKAIERHEAWKCGPRETVIIKKTVHAVVENLLDTDLSISDQDPELVEEVFRQATQMHPDLRKYEDDWATRCIVQARLKYTSSIAASNLKAAQDLLDVVQTAQNGRRTRSKSIKA